MAPASRARDTKGLQPGRSIAGISGKPPIPADLHSFACFFHSHFKKNNKEKPIIVHGAYGTTNAAYGTTNADAGVGIGMLRGNPVLSAN